MSCKDRSKALLHFQMICSGHPLRSLCYSAAMSTRESSFMQICKIFRVSNFLSLRCSGKWASSSLYYSIFPIIFQKNISFTPGVSHTFLKIPSKRERGQTPCYLSHDIFHLDFLTILSTKCYLSPVHYLCK